MKSFHEVLIGFASKCDEVYSTVAGWLVTTTIIIANFFAGYALSASAVLVAVVLDAFWGIASALKRGKFAYSELMRDTITKLTSYGTALVICIFCERLLDASTTLATSVVSAIICATELWSMAGSILIINPDIPLFKLFRHVLTGEIARKLRIDEDKVEEALQSSKEKKTKKVKK